MLDILKRTTLGALLLMIMPVVVMLSGWQWHPRMMGWEDKVLYWFTETVTRPWGVLTTVILCAWFLRCLRFQLKAAILLLVILIATILAGQLIKSMIKDRVEEPRPYVLWLEKTYGINEQQFYQQNRMQRRVSVQQAVADNQQLPDWLKQHWAFDTDSAFPSGHTMFAACWALLAVGLLWPRRRYATIAVLLIWASLVMSSRLVLAMHWPRDLLVSTLISWLLVMLATWLVTRYCGRVSVPPPEKKAGQPAEKRVRGL